MNLVAQIIIFREIYSDLYSMSFKLYLRTIELKQQHARR